METFKLSLAFLGVQLYKLAWHSLAKIGGLWMRFSPLRCLGDRHLYALWNPQGLLQVGSCVSVSPILSRQLQ